MKKLLSDMLILATTKHDGQFDAAGQPYILHPLKVMHYLKTDDEQLQCIALGHDLLEDTDVTFDYLLQHFSIRIAQGIQALTKKEDMSQEDYEDQVLRNQDAIAVKLCDLRHNTDIRRLKGITPKDAERLNKYCRFYTKLQQHK